MARATSTMQSERFCEDLYFMLMTSSLRDRIRALGRRHGLDTRALRNEIFRVGEPITRRIEIDMKQTAARSA